MLLAATDPNELLELFSGYNHDLWTHARGFWRRGAEGS